MSFQAYIDNIREKTGKSPEDFARLAAERGFTEGGTLKKGVKAGQVLEWLKPKILAWAGATAWRSWRCCRGVGR